jgi:hypothetical protein
MIQGLGTKEVRQSMKESQEARDRRLASSYSRGHCRPQPPLPLLWRGPSWAPGTQGPSSTQGPSHTAQAGVHSPHESEHFGALLFHLEEEEGDLESSS